MTKRDEALDQAREIIMGGRASEYGEVENSFGRIAAFWTTYLGNRLQAPIQAADAAAMLDLLKTARIAEAPTHEDSWRDKIGYSAWGMELATETPTLKAAQVAEVRARAEASMQDAYRALVEEEGDVERAILHVFVMRGPISRTVDKELTSRIERVRARTGQDNAACHAALKRANYNVEAAAAELLDALRKDLDAPT